MKALTQPAAVPAHAKPSSCAGTNIHGVLDSSLGTHLSQDKALCLGVCILNTSLICRSWLYVLTEQCLVGKYWW